MKEYSVVIKWSNEDECYIGHCPEFGCFAHGATRAEALKESEAAIQATSETYLEEETKLPIPNTFEGVEELEDYDDYDWEKEERKARWEAEEGYRTAMELAGF